MVLGKQAKILRAGRSNQSLESQLRVPARHGQHEISNVRTVNGLGYFHQDVVLGKNGRKGRRRASNEKTLARISIHQLEPGERLAIELSDGDVLQPLCRRVLVEAPGVQECDSPRIVKGKNAANRIRRVAADVRYLLHSIDGGPGSEDRLHRP